MKAQTVDVKSSTGRVLCCTVFRPGGKKLLAKGHVISDEDVRILESEGMESIWVTELEDGEVGEDDAVAAVAGEMGCGSFEIRLAAGGRANLVATENCCVLVDDELLRQINCTSSVVIATTSPHRAEAFAACRYAIERIKQIAPIWKHEHFEGGDIWIEGATADPMDEDAKRMAFAQCT